MSTLENLRKAARRWLKGLRAGDEEARARMERAVPAAPAHPVLRDVQHALAREQGYDDWLSLRRAAEQRRPTDLQQIERLAHDVLAAYRTGEPGALARLGARAQRTLTWDALRHDLRQRIAHLPRAAGQDTEVALADVQLLLARSAGCDTWNELVATLGRDYSVGASQPPSPLAIPAAVEDARSGMLCPIELRVELPMELSGGAYATTTGVWQMLAACRRGDLYVVRSLLTATPGLSRCEHNYMPPLHLAVREGHADVVRVLLEHGAYDAGYTTYPYKETLETMADDRGFVVIAGLLRNFARRPRPPRTDSGRVHGAGHIEFPADGDRDHLATLVNADALDSVQTLLDRRPDLVHDPFVFYAEGVLAPAANRSQRHMLDLLMARGARVPDVAKWGRFYFFKHADVAATLLERGMNPNHMTWHRTTLLHDMAGEGSEEKALLLLRYGARIDVVDDEFRSTPLGFAARWGRRTMVRLLLERGADPRLAGAEWATPLAWAERKGHRDIAADLRSAGA